MDWNDEINIVPHMLTRAIIWESNIPPDLLLDLKVYCHKNKDNPAMSDYADSLAGRFSHGKQVGIFNSATKYEEIEKNPDCIKRFCLYLNTMAQHYYENYISGLYSGAVTDTDGATVDGEKLIHVDVNDLWFNMMRPGDYNPLHSHGNSSPTGLSFFLYIDIENIDSTTGDGTTDLVHSADPLTAKQQKENFMFPNTIHVPPKNGRMLMFPSWLLHQVYPFKGNKDRISFAGNINVWTSDYTHKIILDHYVRSKR